jgi:hypothetical protein
MKAVKVAPVGTPLLVALALGRARGRENSDRRFIRQAKVEVLDE